MPQVNLTAFTTNTVDYAVGSISRAGSGIWGSIRTGNISGVASQTGTTAKRIGVGFTGGARGTYQLHRSFMWYDITGYTGITAAELTIPTISAGIAVTLPVIAVDATAYSNNSIDSLGQAEFIDTNFNAYSNATNWSQTTNQQNIVFNAAGVAALNASGTNFGVAIIDFDFDFQDVNPGGGLGFDAYYYADCSSSVARSRWQLILTYTAAGWSTGDMNNVANSDMGEVNDVPIANISEINGI
tara:strand:+ start:221 stop:946 length:726 start_codon:yes stop_codon:yes gene_type:complete